ncbi:hypothetical protein BDN72DRAFT_961376 [Pluteus cervinus]|uniref:Uncharacterized protein n=1 Tax=Pluteus cervinus TaxID=181527 RepID=A0ACD3AMG6_9AGAR|nr:hypothetical protein BDN72DRAFT_961376 [Pluteus cervinus]
MASQLIAFEQHRAFQRQGANQQLDDLPYDVLVKVLQDYDLAPHDFLLLAQVSRRFNSFISSFYFTSRGSPNPLNSLTITMDSIAEPSSRIGVRYVRNPPLHPDDIDFLRYSLDLIRAPIDQFICVFESDVLMTTTDYGIFTIISSHHRELGRFIRGFSSIRSITLCLEPRNILALRSASYSTWVMWSHPLNTLLDTCIGKGITEFEIWNGSWCIHDAKVRFAPWPFVIAFPTWFHKTFVYSRRAIRAGPGWQVLSLVKGDPSANWNRLSGYGLRLYTNTVYGGVRVMIKSSLTTLRISSPAILFPPLSKWTYQLVGTSPILTTLILHKIVQLEPSFWRVALSWLREAIRLQNSLKTLTVTECENIPTEPLLHLVRGTGKSLVDLTLLCPTQPITIEDSDLDRQYRSWGRSQNTFPCLQSIRTTQEMLYRLARLEDKTRGWIADEDIQAALGSPRLNGVVVESRTA